MKRAVSALVAALAVISLAACGKSAGSSNALAIPSSPDAATVATWPEKWCSAQPGMSSKDLLSLMGKPTESFPDQASWEGFGWQFNAFYDEDGNVRQLDINDISLSASQKAKITCDTTRVSP